MADSADDILGKIKEPVVEQVGAELKKNYNKLKLLLEIGDNSVFLAEKPSDEEFRRIAKHAIAKRELELETIGVNGGMEYTYVPLEQINQKINSLDQETKKKMGIGHFDINAMIPTEVTLSKVAGAISSGSEETKNSDIAIGINAFLKLVISFFSSLFGKGESLNWDAAKAEAASEHAQGKIKKKLDEIAVDDNSVKQFLKQKSGAEMTVEESINASVPQRVYKELDVTLPENLKAPERKNSIADTVMEPAPEINVDEIIMRVRKAVLYPEGKPSLEEQIAQKVLERSDKRLAEAQQNYDNLSITSPIEKAKARATLLTTKELALQKSDAGEIGGKLAELVAVGVENALKAPEFAGVKNKEEMAELITKKVAVELERNKEDITIVKTITNEVLQGGIKAAEIASKHSEFARNNLGIEKMPPKVGENQYAVVTSADVMPALTKEIYASIDDKVYEQLKSASHFVVKNRNNDTKTVSEIKDPVHEQANKVKVSLGATYPYEETANASAPNNNIYAKLHSGENVVRT